MYTTSRAAVSAPVRYSSLLVSLHWLIALFIFLEAFSGVVFLHFLPNTAVKIVPLTLHLGLGVVMLVLMIVRIFARMLSPAPPPVTAGHRLFDVVGRLTHFLLYVFALLSAFTGVVLAIQSSVLQLLVGGAVHLPMQFAPFEHAAVFVIFALLVGLHVLASLYHQFVRRDSIFARIWYGPS